jgi:alkylated DNA repair dioxygenase AlkB
MPDMQQSLFETIQGINILPYDGEALFYPDFINEGDSRLYMDQLQREYEFRQLTVKLYDKEVLMPKLTAFSGDPGEGLDYTLEDLPVQPWSDTMKIIKSKVEVVSGTSFTHVLLNLYRDGRDGVSWHRDKERHWGKEPVIASLTFGAARIFQFRNTEDKKVTRSIELTPGSLLVMKGASQRSWEHRIPKTNKRIGPRLNLTFRLLQRTA